MTKKIYQQLSKDFFDIKELLTPDEYIEYNKYMTESHELFVLKETNHQNIIKVQEVENKIIEIEPKQNELDQSHNNLLNDLQKEIVNLQNLKNKDKYIAELRWNDIKPKEKLETEAYKKVLTDKLKNAIRKLETSVSSESIIKDKISKIFKNKNYKIKYQKELNLRQLEAATTISGKALVIAGAGTGKTKTITYRAGFLIENGVPSENILLLTFTKKASNEIKNRINDLLGKDIYSSVTTGTFHSFCASLLRKYARSLNIPSNFNILDQSDSVDLFDEIQKDIKEFLPDKMPKNADIYNILSISKNNRKDIETVVLKEMPFVTLKELAYINIMIKTYEKLKQDRNLYDYDDLIEKILFYLKNNLLFRKFIQSQYSHVMIDEYQDTNISQKELLDLLADKEDGSLMVVGDDHQSIYGFRGANYTNILLFSESFPNAKLIKLVENYRSTKNIINFINEISKTIILGYEKQLIAVSRIEGEKPSLKSYISQYAEAEAIVKKIKDLIENNKLTYKDIAVLTRASIDSMPVQTTLLFNKIPFIVVGGLKFTEKRHIKDIIAFIKFRHNSADTNSLKRVLVLLDKIGSVTAKKIINQYIEVGKNIEVFNYLSVKYPALESFYEMLSSAYKEKTVYGFVSTVINYYQNTLVQEQTNDWIKRQEELKLFANFTNSYNSFDQLLEDLTLDTINHIKYKNETEPNKDPNVITVSTIHGSKGLEWKAVFVASAKEGKIPHLLASSFEDIEEEKRLFYVALSRAKEFLNVTFSEGTKTKFITDNMSISLSYIGDEDEYEDK